MTKISFLIVKLSLINYCIIGIKCLFVLNGFKMIKPSLQII